MEHYIVKQSVTHEEWDEYVASCREASGYHQCAWCDVVTRSFGHEVIRLAVRNETNRIVGVLPLVHMKSRLFGNFLVSVPFFNYGGVLCDDHFAGEALLAEAQRIRENRGAAYVELRHRNGLMEGLATRDHKVTMLLGLEKDQESQWKRLDPKIRNHVRKAEKSGLQAVTGRLELLDGFYEVFCRNMRDLGTPVYGKEFFRNVLEICPESTRIISVMLQGKTVASGILTWFRDTLEVPWASSISDYRPICPNNLLYWEAIVYAIGIGVRKFDFGRSTPGEGTYRFKKQWGAQAVQLYWQYLLREGGQLPDLSPKNQKFELAIKVWRHLPLSMTNFLGPRIVKSIP